MARSHFSQCWRTAPRAGLLICEGALHTDSMDFFSTSFPCACRSDLQTHHEVGYIFAFVFCFFPLTISLPQVLYIPIPIHRDPGLTGETNAHRSSHPNSPHSWNSSMGFLQRVTPDRGRELNQGGRRVGYHRPAIFILSLPLPDFSGERQLVFIVCSLVPTSMVQDAY